jgi:hypothetical protein
LMDIPLYHDKDLYVCKLTTFGMFSVTSLYLDHMNGHAIIFTNIFEK